jgi:inner membrane protein
MLPDIDVIGFQFGIHYGDLLGHRGLTHSLSFAVLLATATVAWAYRRGAGSLGPGGAWAFLALATASHGLLDAFTDGGLGIAFFSPFDPTRYFFPWRPIAVAPIGILGLFRPGMGKVIASEVAWVWCPSALVLALAAARRFTTGGNPRA